MKIHGKPPYSHWIFAARCYASAAYAVMRCLCVCLSRLWIVSKWINIFQFFSLLGSQAIVVSPYQMAWQYSNGTPANGVIGCRWGKQKSRFWAFIWLHCVLWAIPVASAIHLAATDHGEFISLVDGKRRVSWWRETLTKSLNVMPKTMLRFGKSEA